MADDQTLLDELAARASGRQAPTVESAAPAAAPADDVLAARLDDLEARLAAVESAAEPIGEVQAGG